MRRCVDRVNFITERTRIRNNGTYHTDEHILVCLSSSPSNSKIIRTAARMAQAFRGIFTALYVETTDAQTMSEEDQKRLRENMRLAQQLGATIETISGEDISYQIAEFARLSGVSKIVIGRSTATRKGLFRKPVLTERLIAMVPNLDIHIIPDNSGNADRMQKLRRRNTPDMTVLSLRDLVWGLLILLIATLIGYGFYSLGFSEVNIVTVYILGVVVISVVTASRICSLLASACSVLVFNFFFTVPRFTFDFIDQDYLVTFAVMFFAAFLTGSLASRLRDNARQSTRSAFRTKILLDTNQLLQKEQDEQAVFRVTAEQLTRLLQRDLVIYQTKGEQLTEP